jgi:hypothetical protein
MPQFVISSQERLGFTKNNEFYSLGTKVDEFHRHFGAAEKAEKEDDDERYLPHTVTDYYVSQGLMVTAKADGRIIGFIFYLVPSPILKVASAVTDRGIAAGATEKDIIKKYGAPLRQKDYKDDKHDDRDLYYKFGESVLSIRPRRAETNRPEFGLSALPREVEQIPVKGPTCVLPALLA